MASLLHSESESTTRDAPVSNLSPVQPQLLSRINEALVLRAIRQHGPSTRGELSAYMGVTFPTVAKAVGSLVEARLLEEFDDVMTGPGRPAKRLRLSKEKSQVIGLTVDVLTCEVASAGFDGVVREGTQAVVCHAADVRRAAGRGRQTHRGAQYRRYADSVHRHQRGRTGRLSSARDSAGGQFAVSRRQAARARI